MKKFILSTLLIISSFNYSFIKALDKFEEDYRSLATSIKNLLDEKSSVLNSEELRSNFIIESGKLIQEHPSFYSLFHIEDSMFGLGYSETQKKLRMIARDLISKSLNLLSNSAYGPAPSGMTLHGYIVNIIKKVKANQNSDCVIL